jgi:hypothetical protein
MPDDFLIDHVSKMMRQTTLPAEIVESIKPRSTGYMGRAFGIEIAGEEVIVIARTLPQLDIVFNKLNPKGTLRTSACPEIVVVAKKDVTLDDEL